MIPGARGVSEATIGTRNLGNNHEAIGKRFEIQYVAF